MYWYSDLARECGCEEESAGVRVNRAEAGGREILRVQIKTDEAAARVGKPCGRYVTVACEGLLHFGGESFEEMRRVLSVELREMAERMTGKRVGADFSLLVAGLGNAEMTPDALGPETVRRLAVTRHLTGDGVSFSSPTPCEIAAFSPGVLGQTGLESVELIRGAVSAMQPDLVLVVDALAARETARLAATVQLADTGVQPGAGVGASRPSLTAETVGVPVMALGVPTVVSTATLLYDVLSRFIAEERLIDFQNILQNGKSFFVSPKEIDLIIPAAAMLLAAAIEKAFSY